MSEPKITEPDNRTIVGFGDPIRAAYVRLDEYAMETGYEPWEHWYPMDEEEHPIRWSAVLDNGRPDLPYRLVREELAS